MSLIKTLRYVNENGDQLILDMAHGYVLAKPDGVDTVSVSLNTAQGIGQMGATIKSRSLQPRPITISGRILGGVQSTAKEKLQSVVRPELTGTLYADDWAIAVVVTVSPTIGAKKYGAEFQFGLVAPYPFWQSTTRVEQHLAGVESLFKFPWNISRAFRFGARVKTAYANLINSGQADCPMCITIDARAAVSNPALENMLTGEKLSLEKSLVPGERLVVDITHEKITVHSNVDGDCRGALTLESDLCRLHVGDNLLKPTAEIGLENMNVTVEFAPERVGVVL